MLSPGGGPPVTGPGPPSPALWTLRMLKIEWHPALILLALIILGVIWLFFRYGTLDGCQMMRQEVRMRFERGDVPAEVQESPGGQLVVGIVNRTTSRFLTYDLSKPACMAKTARMWFASDTEIGAILME